MKYRKIKNPETSRTYGNEAIDLAFMYSPQIRPCPNCNHPVAEGYVCQTCGYGSIEYSKDDV